MRLLHMSRKTEASYLHYIIDFIRFHGKRHPAELGAAEIRGYLSHLAVDRSVSASTQNVAFSALLFLYAKVLKVEMGEIEKVERARRSKYQPTVFTKVEVEAILSHTEGVNGLILELIYGTGVRLSEALRLRVKDIDFGNNQITIHDPKGGQGRHTILPQKLVKRLRNQLRQAREVFEKDLAQGYGEVEMPYALARKYPHGAKSWAWQYVFPAAQRSQDPRTGRIGRHHILEDNIQRAIRLSRQPKAISKAVSTPCATALPPICSSPATTSAVRSLRRMPYRAGAVGPQGLS